MSSGGDGAGTEVWSYTQSLKYTLAQPGAFGGHIRASSITSDWPRIHIKADVKFTQPMWNTAPLISTMAHSQSPCKPESFAPWATREIKDVCLKGGLNLLPFPGIRGYLKSFRSLEKQNEATQTFGIHFFCSDLPNYFNAVKQQYLHWLLCLCYAAAAGWRHDVQKPPPCCLLERARLPLILPLQTAAPVVDRRPWPGQVETEKHKRKHGVFRVAGLSSDHMTTLWLSWIFHWHLLFNNAE